jgi:hypothetical protein
MAFSVSSEFDYFSPQLIADDIEEEYTVAIGPKGSINRKQPVEFLISAENNVYRDLNNSLLEVTCRVTQADGSNLAADAAVAPVNLLLHSLFKSVEVQLNGKRVSDANNYYSERAYLETILNCSEKVLKTRGVCEGWAKDDASAMDSVAMTAAAAEGNKAAVLVNSGFIKRNSWCKASKQMKLVGRLHTDLFHQPLDIPDNVKIEIKLEQNPDSKILLAAAGATFQLLLVSARLLVRSKRLSSDLVLAHRRMLDTKNCRIPFTKVVMKSESVSTGATEHISNNFHRGFMPSRVTVFMVRSKNANGAYNKNPFNFENFNLTNIWLKIGKDKYPHEDLSVDFTDGHYYGAYINTLASLGLDQGERAIAITPEDWSSAFNIYSFKLIPGPINPSILHSLHSQQVSLELHVKFGTALPEPVTVIAYIEQPAILEVDKLGNAIKID